MDFTLIPGPPYYGDFETFVKKQGLRRLELAIDDKQGDAMSVGKGLLPLPIERLRRTLSNATMMESFSLSVGAGSDHRALQIASHDACRTLTVIPIKGWPHLRHFTLSCVPLVFKDFMKSLSKLPSTMEELAFVDIFFARYYADQDDSSDDAGEFEHGEDEHDDDNDDDQLLDQAIRQQRLKTRWPQRAGNALEHWGTALEVCRSYLGYRANKPKFAVAQSPTRHGRPYKPGPLDDLSPAYTFEYRRLWVEDDIAKFFEGGPNPFTSGETPGNDIKNGFEAWRDDVAKLSEGGLHPFVSGETSGKYIQDGFGVWRDDFDENFERPNWRTGEDGKFYMVNP
jgi:hypothetical protein